MNLEERCLTSETIYDGCLLHVRKDDILLPDGGTSVREYIKLGHAVCMVPLTDDDEVLMERQYRYAVGQVIREIPAGKIDDPAEDPLEAAKRELREETGAEAAQWYDLGVFLPAVAYCTETIHMYACKGLTFGERELDEGEFIDVYRMPLEELVDEILAGKLVDSKTQAAILRIWAMRQKGLL